MFNLSNNKRVTDSMDRICESLITLLGANSFRELTINEICDNANVVRKTFYRNFESKIDIIDYILCKEMSEMTDLVNSNSKNHETLLCMLTFWSKRKKLLTILEKNNLFDVFTARLTMFLELFRVHITTIESFHNPQLLEAYYFSSSAAIMSTTLSKWAARNFSETVDDLYRVMIELYKLEA